MLPANWSFFTKVRKAGDTKGRKDRYWMSPPPDNFVFDSLLKVKRSIAADQIVKEIEEENSVQIFVEPEQQMLERGALSRAVRVSGSAADVEAACSQMEGILYEYPDAIASLQAPQQPTVEAEAPTRQCTRP